MALTGQLGGKLGTEPQSVSEERSGPEGGEAMSLGETSLGRTRGPVSEEGVVTWKM